MHPSNRPCPPSPPPFFSRTKYGTLNYQSFCKELSRGYDPVESIEEIVDMIRDDAKRVDTWLDKLLSENPNQPWWAHNHEAETLDNAVNSLQADVDKEIEDDTIREVKGMVDLIMDRAKATL